MFLKKIVASAGVFGLMVLSTNGCAILNRSQSSGVNTSDSTATTTSAPEVATASKNTINGAGASFPAPLYQKWITEYKTQANDSATINYDSIGSGKGVKKYLAQEVDFGASDAPLKTEERTAFPAQRGTPIQVPLTGGLVVFAYNLNNYEGTEELKLSRDSYCGIVTGEIRNWDDPRIAKDNPNIRLPNLPLLFIHRSDGSGTTFIFTNHLKTACPEWKAGSGKTVEWPKTFLGAEGNEGVSSQLQQTPGAIGYTEYSYAKSNNLAVATLQNKAGNFVSPSPENATQAFDKVEIPEDFALVIPDPAQEQAYPIVGLTWLLLYGKYDNADTAKSLKTFITWSLTKGETSAKELGYIPLSNDIKQKVLEAVKNF